MATGSRDSAEWSIELLRGVAALMVVFAHYRGIAGVDPGLLRFAFTGVDLFFVISGFVFAPYLFGRRLHVGAHLVRRFFRLYPLYAVALLCYVVLHSRAGQPVEYLLEHALFLHTLESREVAFHFNPAFWSLPPEVEYYLALPLLAALAGRLRSVLAITAAAMLAHVVAAWHSPVDVTAPMNAAGLLGFHLPGLLVEFMLGTLAWRLVQSEPATRVRIGLIGSGLAAWIGLAALYAALGDGGVGQIDLLRGNTGVLAAMAYAAIVAGFVGWVREPRAWIVNASAWLGSLSYGVYLLHNAAPAALERWRQVLSGPGFALLCFGATLIVAQLLHRAWEAPCRKLGRQIALRLNGVTVT